MTVAAAMLAHQVAGKAVRDALFLSAMPVTDLPRMMIVAALMSLAAVPLYSHLLTWVGPRVLVPAGFLVSALAHVAEWYWFGSSPLVPVAVYIHVASFGALLLSGFWSLTSELFDPHTARQQVVRIATAGSIGGMAGGLLMERTGAWAQAETALLLLAAFHAAAAIGLLPLRSSSKPRAPLEKPEPLFGRQVLTVWPKVREIAALVVLGTASAAIIDYLFKSRAATDYSGGELLQYFAIFYTATQVGTVLFQTLFARRVQQALGIGRSVTALPFGVGVGSVVAVFFPVTPVFATVRFTEYVLRGSVFRSGYELLFSALSPAEKRRVKTFLDVACDRAGDALGAGLVQLLLLVGGSSFLVSELLGVVLVMVAASIWIGERLDARYLRTIEQRLVDHAAENGLVGLSEFGAPTIVSMELPSVAVPVAIEDVTPGHYEHVPVQVLLDEPLDLLRQLRSGERDGVIVALESAARFEAMHVAQALQLLAWDDVTAPVRRALERSADRHVGLLTDTLLDGGTDFAVRRRIPRILISAPTQRALDGLVLGLSDSRFEVRYQCSRAMDRILIAEPTLRVDAARIFQVVERELSVARPVWNGHRLLDQFESADAVMFLDEHLRDRASRSLEHVFSLLVTVLPREPLKAAFRAVHAEEPMLRGLALEYLTGVLPDTVRVRLWDILDADETPGGAPVTSHEALEELLRSQDGLLEQLSRAIASGDDARGQSGQPARARPPSDRR